MRFFGFLGISVGFGTGIRFCILVSVVSGIAFCRFFFSLVWVVWGFLLAFLSSGGLVRVLFVVFSGFFIERWSCFWGRVGGCLGVSSIGFKGRKGGCFIIFSSWVFCFLFLVVVILGSGCVFIVNEIGYLFSYGNE